MSTPVLETVRNNKVILFWLLCAPGEALPRREDEMAQGLQTFRKHLLGVSTLIPPLCQGWHVWDPLRCFPEMGTDFGMVQGALKSGNFISPVTVHFITFFLCEMSADTEGETLVRLRVKGKAHKTVVILEAAVLSLSLLVRVGKKP